MHVIIVYPTYRPLVKRKLQYPVFTMCVGILYKMCVLNLYVENHIECRL